MKKFIFFTLIFSVIAGSMFAQEFPGFTSPTSTATGDLFTSDADNFMRPNSYNNVEFENWFAMMSFQSGSSVNIGYARRLGGLYIGAHYGGTFWYNVFNKSYEESYRAWLGDDKEGVRTFTGDLTDLANLPSNRISLLVGIGDMGFRVSYYTTLNTFKDEDFVMGGAYYKSYQATNGDASPQFAWGMTKSLFEKGVQPWATFNLFFSRDHAKSTQYQINPLGSTTYQAADERITRSYNFFSPSINVGLGGFTFLQKNGFSYSADLSYGFSMTLYNNEYSYAAEDPTIATAANRPQAYKIGTYRGTWQTAGAFNERSSSSHLITPSVGGSWTGETVAIKFNIDLPISINGSSTTPMALELEDDGTTPKYNGKLVRSATAPTGGDGGSKTSTVSFTPAIQLAAQWHIVPKLALNAGGLITFTGWGIETTVYEKPYSNGKKVEDASLPPTYTTRDVEKFHNGRYGGAVVRNNLSIGVSFSPLDNLTFEAVTGVGTAGNIINVFDPDGLFCFLEILVSLKF